MTRPLVIVVAVAENGVIGKDNGLSWRIPSDMKRFRRVTMGKPLIMGRKTYESVGRPLPGREIVVVTRDRSFTADGVHIVHSPQDAVSKADELALRLGADEIIVAGGADIYAALLPQAARIDFTRVHADIEGDAAFPSLAAAEWREAGREEHAAEPGDDHAYALITYVRKGQNCVACS
ncbi:dihydrofolate reductase [Rhizobiales bacterium GAS191]|nr:dihydrofolate reductase [Rhizobiales bacterium GAS191]